ncbi:MAG: hypothetical protein E7460_04240 [Ruminococcaceae bacterium]|nr:hypothetical protein [Oscillospiraceae bacterium]
MLKELLDQRELLPILQMNDGRDVTLGLWPERRAEMLDALCRHSYGYTPECTGPGKGEVVSEDIYAYAGKVLQQQIKISFPTPSGVFSFMAELFIPKSINKPPVFLNLAFCPVPHRYIPVEEITDRGFALLVVCYQDIVNDGLHGNFSDGLAKAFGTDNPRSPDEWGKIGMWAYGASRALDYILTREDLDGEHTAVVGHSRLGKTALWTAAQDERFWCACSNNSGYGGAASSKHGTGERVDDFLRCGSWDWYCENFKLYRGEKEDSKPYDQAYLLALIAPRLLLVGSAEKDRGADPLSEFLTTLHASAAWKLLGEKGLVTPDRLPLPGEQLNDGNPCYHLRPHRHFFSRQDWNAYMDALNKKLNRDL